MVRSSKFDEQGITVGVAEIAERDHGEIEAHVAVGDAAAEGGSAEAPRVGVGAVVARADRAGELAREGMDVLGAEGEGDGVVARSVYFDGAEPVLGELV